MDAVVGGLETCRFCRVGVLKLVMHLLFIFVNEGVGEVVTKLTIFCGQHKCMTP